MSLRTQLRHHKCLSNLLIESYKLLTSNDATERSQGLSGLVIAEETHSFHVYQTTDLHLFD